MDGKRETGFLSPTEEVCSKMTRVKRMRVERVTVRRMSLVFRRVYGLFSKNVPSKASAGDKEVV